ncbi:MAG: nucleotidyl transferase AbiEii/AbiGii toxin family protein [Candidatus Rokuibacteriota bacterium]
MKYSREYLDQRSASTGFRPDTLEKVLRLLRLLDQVTRHPFLGSRLLLKGGTALNLFYAAAPRLSVDLDFNYVGSVARDQMLQERPEVESAINQVVVGEGYRVQWGRDEHAGRKLYLTYVSGLGSQDRIEVDLNYLFRVSLADPEIRSAWTPDPDFPCEARLVSREEVMAGKLLALLDRVAARDLYDVAAFAATPSAYDLSVLRCFFVALSGVLPRALSAYDVRHLDRFTQQSIDMELALMLRSGETPIVGALGRGWGLCSATSSRSRRPKRNMSSASSGGSWRRNWWWRTSQSSWFDYALTRRSAGRSRMPGGGHGPDRDDA